MLLFIDVHCVAKLELSIAGLRPKNLDHRQGTVEQRMSIHAEIVIRYMYLVFLAITRVKVNAVWSNDTLQILFVAIKHRHARFERRIEDAAYDHSSFSLLTFKNLLNGHVSFEEKHPDLKHISIEARLFERHTDVSIHI